MTVPLAVKHFIVLICCFSWNLNASFAKFGPWVANSSLKKRLYIVSVYSDLHSAVLYLENHLYDELFLCALSWVRLLGWWAALCIVWLTDAHHFNFFPCQKTWLLSPEFDLHTCTALQISPYVLKNPSTSHFKESLKESQLPVLLVHNPGEGGSDLIFISWD